MTSQQHSPKLQVQKLSQAVTTSQAIFKVSISNW